MRVLIIDDSALARAQLRTLLMEAGMEVFEQPSAIGATRNIIQNRIDVALVDVTMPGLSGDKLVGVLRQNPRLQGLLIVLVSAKSSEELRAIGDKAGADAVVSKEQVGTDLVKLLRRLQPLPTGSRQTQRKGACVK
jgi:two-component system chemotaxis response regulator CheY